MFETVTRWSECTGRAITHPVMIVSYETLRNLQELLGQTEVGLLLCDEGHRLKNSDSLTFQTLDMLNVKRRVILSGTPIQNDLSEYFSLINFAIPDVLGSRLEFRKQFELDILKGRDALATEKQQEASREKLQQLSKLVSQFIIRRTNDILSKYLPVKYEHVVFCNLSPFQLALYDLFVKSPAIKKLLRGVGSQPLKAIGILKKLCNHPDLLKLPDDLEGSDELFPTGYKPQDRRNVPVELSGKMAVLERFLTSICTTSDDKIVLISNYTQTLDIFERLCRSKRWGCFRLDGTMNISKRQRLVDRFNDPAAPEFIFLLSSKAGGCGLNLIGANRLVLFDPDWNPASDQQALARVWRDGQKKSCTCIGLTQVSCTASLPRARSKRRSCSASRTNSRCRRVSWTKPRTWSATFPAKICVRCSSTKATHPAIRTIPTNANGVKTVCKSSSRPRCSMAIPARTSPPLTQMEPLYTRPPRRTARRPPSCRNRARRRLVRLPVL